MLKALLFIAFIILAIWSIAKFEIKLFKILFVVSVLGIICIFMFL